MKKLFLSIMFLLPCVIQAAEPDWITTGVIDEYRNSRYLTALGDGDSLEDARKSAYARLAEQIKVNISSESDIFKEYRSTQESSSQQENVNIRISTSVELENIKGIKIVDQYFQSASKTHYAFAVLNKLKTATNLLFGIEEDLARIREQHKEALGLINKGQVSEGIKNLIQSTQKFAKVSADLELHKLFADPSNASLAKSNVLDLIKEIDGSLRTIFGRVQVLAFNAEKSGSPELGVDEPYQLAFSYQGQPLKQVPVKITPDVEGFNIEANDTTDSRGNLSVKVRSYPYSGREFNRIKVQLDLYDDLFEGRSPSTDLIVMQTQKSNVSIQLSTTIDGSNTQLAEIVDNGLANMLSEQNYIVISDANTGSIQPDYVLQVNASTISSPGINGLFFSRIDGVIKIISGKSNRVLKTLKIDREATKAGGLTGAMASEKSAHRVAKSIEDELLVTLEANLGRD
jgi:hypothetical protein